MVLGNVQEISSSRGNDLGAYHTYDEMTAHLEQLEASNPGMVRMVSLGKTFEGRDIWGIELSNSPGEKEIGENGVLLMGGHHARELISVEVPLGILDFMVQNYEMNGTVRGLVDNLHIWFVPMVNPDGHVYVEEGNDWRKNRRPNGDGTFGVDINRNYGHRWGEEAVHDPSDETYCGPSAFSEKETQAIRSMVENNSFDISLSYHSTGGFILHPWGVE